MCQDPEDAALPCPICDGKGVFAYDVPLNDPRYGKFQRCPNHPVEADFAMHERLRRFGNLDAYREMTFDSFRLDLYTRGYSNSEVGSLQKAKAAAEEFAKDAAGGLVLEGPFGCGKTHLAAAIANLHLETTGKPAILYTAPDLLDDLRRSFNPRSSDSFEDYFELLKTTPLLILDDLGVENPTDWAKEKFFQLLNYRHLTQAATVITTNTPLNELEPRLSSRLLDDRVVKRIQIDAPSFRQGSARERSGDRRSLYEHMQFNNFSRESDLSSERENLLLAYRRALEWAQEPRGWLCIIGEHGNGKTHLAAAIANYLYENVREALLTNVPDLLDYLRETFDPHSHSRYGKRFYDVQRCPILILDDLRMRNATPWAKEKLFQIVDYRYMEKLPTVITTSETMDELDYRFVTRLADKRLCTIFAIEARPFYQRLNRKSAK